MRPKEGIDPKTGWFVERVINFAGHPETWFVWAGDTCVAHSNDGVNWTIGVWMPRENTTKTP